MKKNKFSFKRLIYNDRILMVLSVLLGIIVWVIIAWIVEPTFSMRVNGIPVTYDKTSLDKLGLSVISGQNETVSIEVTGNRATVGELSPDNFIAKASLVGVDAPGTYPIEVQVSKRLQNTDYDIQQPQTPILVSAKFDRYISKKISLGVDLSKLTVPDGYIMEAYYITPTEVTVSGPEAEVSRVTRCMVEPELPETLNKTDIEKGPIVLYDASGKRIELGNMKLDKDTAEVTIPVLKKKVLPLHLGFTNVPEGFPISDLDYTLTVNEIEVAGPAETVDTQSSINIGYVSLKEIGPEYVKMFDLDLPQGFANIQNVTEVMVKIASSGFEERKFNIKSANIHFINEPENYTVKLESRGISNIKLVGPPDILDKITASDIVGEIDLSESDLSSGSHKVPVQIFVPSRGTVWAFGDYSAVISVKEK